jgi:hypothetical protein
MNETTLKKLTPWVPLMIAAGYFLFLVMTWNTLTVNLKAADARFDAMLAKLEKGNGSERAGDNSDI